MTKLLEMGGLGCPRMSETEATPQAHRDLLLELALLVNERGSVGEIFASLAGRILEAADFDYTSLLVVDADPRYVRVAASFPIEVGPAVLGARFREETVGLGAMAGRPEGLGLATAELPGLDSTRNLREAGMERAWATALLDDGETHGIFMTARRRDEPFSPSQVEFLRAVARLLATAVRQERDLRDARAAAERARAANALSLALNTGDAPTGVFEGLAELLGDALPFDYASLILREGGRNVLAGEIPCAYHDQYDLAEHGDVVQVVLDNGGLTETRTDRIGPMGERLHAAGIIRVVDVALVHAGEPLGLVSFGRKSNTPFSATEREFISLLANIFGQALANHRRFSRTEAAAARSHVLNEVALLLHQGERIEAIFQRLLDLIDVALEVDYVGFLEPGEAPETMRMVGSRPELVRPAGTVASLEELRMDLLDDAPGVVVQYRVDRQVERSPFNQVMHHHGMRRVVSIPIRRNGRLLGFLSLARRREERYDTDEVAFLETLATMLGQATVNQQRLARTQVAAARARLLNDASLLLNAGQPVRAIFDQLLPLLHESVEFEYVSLFQATGDPGTFRRVARDPEDTGDAGELYPEQYLGIPRIRALGEGITTYRFDRTDPEVGTAAALRDAGFLRGASALIEVEGAVEGLFTVARKRDIGFTAEERGFLVTLARMLGQAIANRRRLEESLRAAARSRLLSEIAVLLNHGEPPEAFFQRLADQLQEVFPFDGMVLLVAEGRHRLRVVQSVRKVFEAGSVLRVEDLGEGLIARLRESSVVEGATGELDGPIVARSREAGMRRGATVALHHDGSPLGYLMVGRAENEPFNDEERAYLQPLGTLLAQALANHQKVEDSRAEAIRSQVLSELAVLLQGGSGVQDHFGRLSELLLQAVGFDFLSITLPDPVTGGFSASRSEELFVDGEPVRFEPAGIAVVRSAQGGITQYRTEQVEGRAVPAALARAGFQRAVTALIPVPEGPEGLLTIARRDDLAYSDRDMVFIELVAALLGQAAANHLKTHAREAEALRNRILSELAILLSDGEPVEAHFNRLRELLLEGVGFDYCSVVAREPTGEGFRTMRSIPVYDEDGRELPFDPSGLNYLVENNLRSSQYGLEGMDNGAPGNLFDVGLRMVFSVLLSAGTGVEGALTVGRKSQTPFRRPERTFFELVGSLLSYAIANERRIAMSSQEAEEQGIIAGAAAAVARETGTLAIVKGLREVVGRFIPAAFVNFGYFEGASVVFPATDGGRPSVQVGPNLERARDEGQVVVAPGEALTGEARDELERLGVQGHVLTTAASGGLILGLLVVGSRDPSFEFGSRELRLLRLIADIAGPAMANVRALERERQEAEDQRVLAEIAAVCAREGDPTALVNSLHRPLRVLVPRPVAVFGFHDGDEIVFPRGDGTFVSFPMDPYMTMAADLGQIHAPELPDDGDPNGMLRQLGLHATCTTAVRAAGATVGFFMVGSRAAGYRFGQRERALFRLVSQIVGPAMENARAAMRAREEAEEQRILAEVAAACAREPDADSIINALPAAIGGFIPDPVILDGEVHGEVTHYRISAASLRGFFGANTLVVPFTPAGFVARDHGQATANVSDLPPGNVYTAFGVHAFALTSYYSGGSVTSMFLVASRDPGFVFTNRHLEVLRKLVQVLGPAIEAARAQHEIARQGDLYSLILRSLTEGVVLIDQQGQAVFANDVGRKILRALNPDVPVTDWQELLPHLPREVRDSYVAAFIHGEAAHGRASLTIEGEPRHFDYELVPLADPRMKVLLVAIDVTADVVREEEEERNRERMAQASRLAALGELIGGVAHELNNPLTAILGFAEIIALSDAATPVSEEIAVIQKEALRARNIVRDLLFIARPGTSERQLVPVTELVAHIERLRRSHWAQLGITAETRIEPGCAVWGNEHQLTQVILNLVTNAEQVLAGRQGARLTVAAERQGERTRIIVADNGAGMDEATRARIFEPFFTTRPGHGTGLGLPLSYSIVQSHQGSISVTSAPGKGATFTIDLPASPTAPVPAQPPAPVAPRPAARVLVVDDEPSLRKVCQRLIASLGHECETAENTKAALELAGAQDFDIVLCDYRLATETADQVLEGLARVAPRLIPKTIIATGATTDPGVVQLVERYGLRLVAKPYGVEELSQIIEESRAEARG
jgi:signal transduction histidine kinase/CheY-like chemotaxis protein/transcriptional regulator with GAF, ATPase, and Fis domain